MKKILWRGFLLILAFVVIGWIVLKIIIFLNSIWGGFYYLFIPQKESSLLAFFLNNILRSIFSIVCTLMFFFIIGLTFNIGGTNKSLANLLLRPFSRIPGIKLIINLISQIVEASENIRKKKNKLAAYKNPVGKTIFGIIRPEEKQLVYNEKIKKNEKAMSFYEAFTPYLFSGKPYLVPIKDLYEISNISFEDYLKYIATAGLFFKLPKKIFLKRIKNNQIEEIPAAEIIENSKSTD